MMVVPKFTKPINQLIWEYNERGIVAQRVDAISSMGKAS